MGIGGGMLGMGLAFVCGGLGAAAILCFVGAAGSLYGALRLRWRCAKCGTAPGSHVLGSERVSSLGRRRTKLFFASGALAAVGTGLLVAWLALGAAVYGTETDSNDFTDPREHVPRTLLPQSP